MAEHLYRKRISASSASNVDDMVSKNVLAQLRRDPPPRPPSHPPKSSGGGAGSSGGVDASDLLSSMAKRLAALEREMKERQAQLQQVQVDNAALKTKLKAAEEEVAKRAMAAIEPRDDSPAVMHLRAENARLRSQLKYAWKQVAEMKAFLNDYGMVWMGEPEAEAELVAHGFGPAGSAPDGDPSPSGSAGGPLQALLPDGPDGLAPRRRSHAGAGSGPSSAAAAAAAAAAVGGGGRRLVSGVERTHSSGRGAAAAAAAAALVRAGEAPLDTAAMAARRGGSIANSPRSAVGSPSVAGGGVLPPIVPPPAMPVSAPAGATRPGLPFSMAELKSKVDELNDLAGDGVGQVVKGGAGAHVLSTKDPVNLVIFRDGLQIHTLPAKPFADSASSAVLRDIMDGYFPYVLKNDFPDGVPLRVVDRSGESIDSAAGGRPGGGGRAAGGGSRGGNIHSWDEIDSHAGAAEPMSREKFLSRLPQAVIKNGKVIEVRGDIARMLGGPGSASRGGDGEGGAKAEVALVSTPVDALLSTLQRNHVGPSLPPPSREGQPPATEVTTLQVKSVDGKQTYIMKMKYDDTVAALRACINAHHAKSGHSGLTYEIRSAFPARAYTDEGETLRQAGLVPNATLFLRAV
ncbi:hypothetical protein GPECTOR_41g720 [Gonium pectorale]|uniref:UBX domain-containing protein n=1 Tax=Gonium pectorale TaxID=33097 RepID=A0A150GAZ6_GONPE|nr:hypothetical protein GPECTOR_41g720 [Gonium pectorale]|eukprot:KXZ46755.1 hypothetical protein GPECTOR_41g720 [Gonium pectorale]